MSRNRFQQLLQYLHFVDNNNIDKNDKSAKIKPISEAVRNEFVKVEPDEFHSIDEQIIPSKTKFSSIHQYSPKKPKNGDLIILSVLGPLVLCTTYIYQGKNNNEPVNSDYGNLQQYSQVVARLTKELPDGMNHELLFNNWFSTLDLIIYLKSQNILAVGTIRLNRLGGCSMDDSKSLQKSDRVSMDCRTDNNSGIIIVKWVDNSVEQLVSNFDGIDPMSKKDKVHQKDKVHKDMPCPAIVMQYKSMGRVDLADMLIGLYRIPCKTKR